jgi:hypothetical protein
VDQRHHELSAQHTGPPSPSLSVCECLCVCLTLCVQMRRQPHPNYMSRQRDITPKMKEILMDCLIDVHYKFKLQQDTLYLTANIIDRFLSRREVLCVVSVCMCVGLSLNLLCVGVAQEAAAGWLHCHLAFVRRGLDHHSHGPKIDKLAFHWLGTDRRLQHMANGAVRQHAPESFVTSAARFWIRESTCG